MATWTSTSVKSLSTGTTEPIQLTHQHTDLKHRFQAEAAAAEARRTTATQTADIYEELKRENTELRQCCRQMESRLEIYATRVASAGARTRSLSGRDAGAARGEARPRRRQALP
ncbi:hypothetical protein GCM10017744_103210 [Streptomyces antimycoticus]|uniref:Uncharacterized protein n=1 Tax=Streptomyces antimycoticus TaxID=68175 RepID=A0A4D4KK74_9ACTN|nr:hypothetical protein SANT12839_102370 [Streptomyces antimycoticus]